MKLKLKNFKCYEEKEFNFSDDGLTLLSGSSGTGKCLGENTKIWLSSGEIKNVQEIDVNDVLIGDDNEFRKVLSITSGEGRLYKIIPRWGQEFVVNSSHILTLAGDSPVSFYHEPKKMFCVEFVDRGVKKQTFFKTIKESNKFYNKLPKIPIFDIEIEEYIKLKSKCCYCIRSPIFKFHNEENKNVYMPYLFGVVKVWLCNIIPFSYKTSSWENRLSLLAGIIDSSAKVFRRREFGILYDFFTITIDKKFCLLANDIKDLAFSLGFMVNLIKNDKNYIIEIWGNYNELPLVIFDKYKLKNCDNVLIQKFVIIPEEKYGKYYGFELSGNGRFLLNDGCITHNSTILQSINFALFGVKGREATLSHGKTKNCIVELEWKNYKIRRSRAPKNLQLHLDDEIYEDEVAQNIISKKFSSTFDISGYIAQNALNSFIAMSATDKLEFLERFAFADLNIQMIKELCKDREKEFSSQFKLLEKESEVLQEQEKFRSKDLKVISKNFKGSIIENKNKLEIKKSNRKKKISLLEQEIKQSIENIGKQDLLFKTIEMYKNQVNQVKSDILKINEKVQKIENDDINYFSDEKELQDVLCQIKKCEKIENLHSLENCEKQDTKNKIEELKDELKLLLNEKDENDFLENQENLQELLITAQNINNLENQLKEIIKEKSLIPFGNTLEDKIKEINQKLEISLLYSCPSCNTTLSLSNDILEIQKKHIESEELIKIKNQRSDYKKLLNEYSLNFQKYQTLSSKESKLNKKIETEKNNYDDGQEFVLKNIEDAIEKNKNNILRIQTLKSEIYSLKKSDKKVSLILEKAREECLNINKEIFTTKLKISLLEKQEILEKSIVSKKIKNTELLSLRNQLTELIKREEILNRELSGETKKFNSDEKSILQKKLIELEKEIDNLKSELINLDKLEKAILDYENFCVESEKLDKLKKQIEIVNDKKEEKRLNLVGATELYKLLLEAESIAVSNIIETINNSVLSWLDEFFTENQIIVKLLPFKETKTTKDKKAQLNIIVEYKGVETDISSLSGGELARVNLAFTLALNELFGTPFLLLDECTASLDQELTDIVFSVLKEQMNKKFVIIVAHQCVSGTFDNVIAL